MKGRILDFSIQTNTGIITGEDHKRYNFVGSEWKETKAPVRGYEVDFEINAEGQATGVYLEIAANPIPAIVNTPTKSHSSYTSPATHESSHKAKEAFRKWEQGEDNYQQAIFTCFKKFADFKGRARRREFWYFELFCVLLSLLLSFMNEDLATLAILITLIPNIVVNVRRLHDINRSGWWMLIALVPIVGVLLLLFWAAQEGNPSANQYGESPKA
ncbi:TPA: DUF805 domain-containing protein [Acinetobacter nosocomialis]|uniref:DUF805 domain-containing protein n=1 Tax=Acinetobacter baumannii TaxID=470 RepID=UPI00056FE1C0|nr:DUF805 domain-containing protein [Acinetobacter baumannii]HAV4990418.1 DUF805 domain-containing protein [Acinetobacter nosocomialis]EKT9038569.1 DUF805 domain-containing protein [Acinetobacter baumannii]EKU1483943.1 DUF805 domain-containing protein [Acinetobacter baumannii]EKU5668913.1 DUF805 domain-containing protein [Acinetobacter baumannii]EKU6934385.1 DUF805 domain-containing protein [Acinetobacter baumannii]